MSKKLILSHDTVLKTSRVMQVYGTTAKIMYRYAQLIGSPPIHLRPRHLRIQSGQWIGIPNTDQDPGGQKLPTKKKKKFRNFSFEVLDVLFSQLKASFVTWTSFMEDYG
jgi:hypothetical protein